MLYCQIIRSQDDSTNVDNLINGSANDLELDALFTFSITIAEISPNFLKRIIKGYASDNGWAKLQRQLQTNQELGTKKALLPHIIRAIPQSDTDPYFKPCLYDTSINPLHSTSVESNYKYLSKLVIPSETSLLATKLLKPLYTKDYLIYHFNWVTSVCRLRILLLVTNGILPIAYWEGHTSFSQYFEIVSQNW